MLLLQSILISAKIVFSVLIINKNRRKLAKENYPPPVLKYGVCIIG